MSRRLNRLVGDRLEEGAKARVSLIRHLQWNRVHGPIVAQAMTVDRLVAMTLAAHRAIAGAHRHEWVSIAAGGAGAFHQAPDMNAADRHTAHNILLWHSASSCDLRGLLMRMRTGGYETPGGRLAAPVE
jgi:hypothetical protein